jgi:hypothetical protein
MEISEFPDSEIPAGWEKAPDWDMGLVRVGIGARIWRSGSWMMYSPGISGWWVVDPYGPDDLPWVASYFTFGEDNDPDTVPTLGPFATAAEACAACPPDPAPYHRL